MEPQEIKIGDFVRHRHLGSGVKLYVVLNNETKILTRYYKEGIFYDHEFYLHEVELWVDKPRVGLSSIGI